MHLAERVASLEHSSPAAAAFLLDWSSTQVKGVQSLAWMLPLAVAVLHNAVPVAAPELWLQVSRTPPPRQQLTLWMTLTALRVCPVNN